MKDKAQNVSPGASPQDATQLPQLGRPPIPVSEHKAPKKKNDPEPPINYKNDWLESLSFADKVTLAPILLIFLFGYLWKTGINKPSEYSITTLISVAALIAVIVQAYINKRQWFGMRKGLEKTESLLEQNERIIRTGRRQAKTAKEGVKQNWEMFLLTERPIVIVENVEGKLELLKPIKPTVKIVNKGRSAAQNLRFFFQVTKPGVLDFPFGRQYVECPFLAAQDSLTIYDNRLDPPSLSDDDFLYVVEVGSGNVYVYGDGGYEDSVGNFYRLDEWAFRWTKEYGWINDYSILDAYPAILASQKDEMREILSKKNDKPPSDQEDDREKDPN